MRFQPSKGWIYLAAKDHTDRDVGQECLVRVQLPEAVKVIVSSGERLMHMILLEAHAVLENGCIL